MENKEKSVERKGGKKKRGRGSETERLKKN